MKQARQERSKTILPRQVDKGCQPKEAFFHTALWVSEHPGRTR